MVCNVTYNPPGNRYYIMQRDTYQYAPPSELNRERQTGLQGKIPVYQCSVALYIAIAITGICIIFNGTRVGC